MIGILANFKPNDPKPLGKQTLLIQGFFEAARILGVEIGLFHPAELLKTSHPEGFVFRDGVWIQEKLEAPGVIYDRLYSSISGFDDPVLALKRSLEYEKQIPFLNPLDLSIDVTDKLAFSHLMQRLEIDSPAVICDRCDDPGRVWDTMRNFSSVILKPRFGRMGRGIIRLKTDSNKIRVKHDRVELAADNRWELSGMLTQICHQNDLHPHDLLMQELIEIKRFDRRFFDVRILVQRIDGESDPTITGEVARVSSPDATVPNIDQGGIPVPLDSWLHRLYGSAARSIHTAMRDRAIAAWSKLEARYGKIGELGIDLLIDIENRIWIVEMNSKPGRIAFDRLASGFGLDTLQRQHFAELRKISILNPIRYCDWLARH